MIKMKSAKLIIIFLAIFAFGRIAVCQTDPFENDELIRVGTEFVNLLNEGNFIEAVAFYDSTMQKAMPVEKLKSTWESLEKQVGAFEAIEKIDLDLAGEYQQVNILCKFENSSLNVRVVLDREKKVSGLWFLPASPVTYSPPDYVDIESFSENEILFGLPCWELPGAISIPKGENKVPAAVLVHGSGPNDRNESIGPNQPFRDLAWGLASRGIAVLRYDKRTKIHGKRMIAGQTTVENEVILDALAAIKLLRKRPEIDDERIFLVGHSLGALLAPEIAVRDGNLAGIILLAAPARTLEEALIDQLKYVASLRENKSNEEELELKSLMDQISKLEQNAIQPNEMIFGAAASYYYDLKKRDQIAFAKQLSIPILILQGGRDYQATMADFEIWQEALQTHKKVKFIDYPNLNHLFMTGEGMATPQEYMQQKGNVALEVILNITEWLRN